MARLAAMPQLGKLLVAPPKCCRRIHQHRARAQCVEELLLTTDQRGHRLNHPLPSLLHSVLFVGDVRHHPLRGIGWRRGSIVGNEVEDRTIRFVPYRAHHRGPASSDGSNQAFV